MNSVIHKMLGVPIGAPNFSVSMKRDPLVIGSAIAAGAGLLGSLIGGNQQRKAVREQNQTNLEIARQTNATNMRMADENNKMQWQMMMENNAFNKEQAIDMFNRENAYNSPLQQVSRLRAAGLNPANVLNSGGASVSGQADGSTPQAASSGITPTMPNLVTPHMEAEPSSISASIQNISQLAGALSSIATAKNQNAQATQTFKTLDAQIRSLLATAADKEASAAYRNAIGAIESVKLPRKLESEISKNFAQAWLAERQGDVAESEKLLKDIEREFTNTRNKQLIEQGPLIVQQLQSAIGLAKAQAKAANATAHNQDAQARGQEILNNVLPDEKAQEITLGQLDVIDKVMSVGRPKDKYQLINQLITQGIRKDLAKQIGERFEQLKKNYSK